MERTSSGVSDTERENGFLMLCVLSLYRIENDVLQKDVVHTVLLK